MLRLEPSLPQLEVLRLASNRISTLSTPPTEAFRQLRELSFESNELDDWPTIRTALGRLPQLSLLVLAGNKLSSITANQSSQHFATLRQLSLADKQLSSLDSIAALHTDCPILERLSLLGNRFASGASSAKHAR